ncbi:MAG: hypothetical protein M1399_07345 [Actinobacteria bacterium]|nr:hypothetical protein [Actinomycetota bacterium]
MLSYAKAQLPFTRKTDDHFPSGDTSIDYGAFGMCYHEAGAGAAPEASRAMPLYGTVLPYW